MKLPDRTPIQVGLEVTVAIGKYVIRRARWWGWRRV